MDEYGHGPLILEKDNEWLFVKTARKPYDLVVSFVLLRTFMLVPGEFRGGEGESMVKGMKRTEAGLELGGFFD